MSLHQASATHNAQMRVCADISVQVCVLTYKRPALLRATLESLIHQQTGRGNFSFHGNLRVQILVVDNDISMGGRHVVEQLAEASELPVRYVSEPARGLSIARNRALQESGLMDFVAFIDDDETAHSDWIVRLVDAAFRFSADVVTGPVHPQHQNSPAWIKRGGFFNPQPRLTGSEVPFVATNNVLLSAPVIRAFRFDSRFDATGGEDTEFFMRITRAGHNIVWVEEAVVTEHIPAERANLRWLLNRARSDANRYTRSCLSFDRGPRTILRRLATACGGFLLGVAYLPGVIWGHHHAVRGLQLIYRSIGTLTALRGQAQIYYKVSDD